MNNQQLLAVFVILVAVSPLVVTAFNCTGYATGVQAHVGAYNLYRSKNRPFQPYSPFNTPIRCSPSLDSNSAALISTSMPTTPTLYNINMDVISFGLPFYDSANTANHITFSSNTFAINNPYPIDTAWYPNDGGDHKLNVINSTSGFVYETWEYTRAAGSTPASVGWANKVDFVNGIGADLNLLSNPYGASPTGAGISQTAGVIRFDEITSGSIRHALAAVTNDPRQNCFRYPAFKGDGTSTNTNVFCEGMRVQLDPTYDLSTVSGIPAFCLTVGRALQNYGAYIMDTGAGNHQALGFYTENPCLTGKDTCGLNSNGDSWSYMSTQYRAKGMTYDWANCDSYFPRNKFRVLSVSETVAPITCFDASLNAGVCMYSDSCKLQGATSTASSSQCVAWGSGVTDCCTYPGYIGSNSATNYKRIINTNGSTKMCVSRPSNTLGTQVNMQPCSTTDVKQQWLVLNNLEGTVTLRAKDDSTICLNVRSASTSNGAAVEVYKCNGYQSQRFKVNANGFPASSIVDYNSGKCLDITGSGSGVPAAGTPVETWDCAGSQNQKLTIQT